MLTLFQLDGHGSAKKKTVLTNHDTKFRSIWR